MEMSSEIFTQPLPRGMKITRANPSTVWTYEWRYLFIFTLRKKNIYIYILEYSSLEYVIVTP